jgi:glycosyltransferase involved in cell wall biosynthesis
MKICIVSPFPEGGDTYPQVACFARYLRQNASVEWVTIWERGFRLDRLIDNTLLAGDIAAAWRASRQIATDWRSVARARRGCDLIVALDFMALVLGSLGSAIPVILWSHDFIPNDEERHARKINQLWLGAVRRALRKAKGVIVQDAARGSALMSSIGDTGRVTPYLLPVSLPPADGEARSSMPGSKPKVIQIGGLSAWRSCTDFLLDQFAAHPDRFSLFLHGSVDPDVSSRVRAMPDVEVSDGFVESTLIPGIVSRGDIGFIGYKPVDQNFASVKNASGQLVEYLRCGKPLISMGTNDLGTFLETEGAGRSVRDSADFFDALATITNDYATFSANARRLHAERYDFNRYAPGLLAYLKQTAGSAAQDCRQTKASACAKRS